jgi:hypothetical protein
VSASVELVEEAAESFDPFAVAAEWVEPPAGSA